MTLAIAAAILTYLVGWPVYKCLIRWGVIDRPNARSSHSRPTARGGGIAVLAVFLPLATFAAGAEERSVVLLVLLGSTAVLAAVSFVDDLRTLPATVRLGFHALAACAFLLAFNWPDPGVGALPDLMGAAGSWIGFALAALWIAGYANAFNFMDGINGLAAGQAAITGAGMALLGGLALGDFTAAPVLVSWVVAGAAAGFLPHNFPRARMFMGDVGSVSLGFVLASVALWMMKIGGWELIVPLALLHANFVLDSGITLLRRVLRGERFSQAHREHFYQRLVRAGKGHNFVTIAEMALQAMVVVLLVLFMKSGTVERWYIAITIVTVWLAFFRYAEACFCGSQRTAVR